MITTKEDKSTHIYIMLKILGLTIFIGFLLNLNTLSVLAQSTSTIAEVQGFNFELQDCEVRAKTDTPLKCDFKVTNVQGGTRELVLLGNNSRAIDAGGNVIAGSTVSLGNQEYFTSVENDLINGIPIKGSVTFETQPVGVIVAVVIHFKINYEYFDVELIVANSVEN